LARSTSDTGSTTTSSLKSITSFLSLLVEPATTIARPGPRSRP